MRPGWRRLIPAQNRKRDKEFIACLANPAMNPTLQFTEQLQLQHFDFRLGMAFGSAEP